MKTDFELVTKERRKKMKIEFVNGSIVITPQKGEFPVIKKWLKKYGNANSIPFMAFVLLIKSCEKTRKRLKEIGKVL